MIEVLPSAGGDPQPARFANGSALIVALWSLIAMSVLVGTLVYTMQLEARLTSHHRKKIKAQALARGGVEWAKLLITKSESAFKDEMEYGDEFRVQAINFSRGLAVQTTTQELGLGTFTVNIIPEQGRRNVNLLVKEDWQEIFDQGRVPEDLWPELIDNVLDWIDADDLHRLNGAEEDDSFYRDKDYTVKNAPLDTIDELLLVKGFTREMVYGGPGEDEDEAPMPGFARWLTTFGDGRVNVNTASGEVLLTFPEVDEFAVENLIEGRLGLDGEGGTEDDGFRSVAEAIAAGGLIDTLANGFSVDERRYVRIVSVGEVQGVKSGIWSIFQIEGRDMIPLFWREEPMP